MKPEDQKEAAHLAKCLITGAERIEMHLKDQNYNAAYWATQVWIGNAKELQEQIQKVAVAQAGKAGAK